MKEKCVLKILLDSTSRPFYTASDIVSGYVQAAVLSKIQVTDLELVLKCEERASVVANKRDAKKSDMKRVKKVREKVRHYTSVQHPLHTEKGEQPLTLEKGEYVYPFTFHLSDDINKLPPHAPIQNSQGLDAGIWWSLEATIHRPKLTQTAFKTGTDVPIQPLPPLGVEQPTEENSRTISGGFAIIQDKPNFLDVLKGQRPAAHVVEAQLGYPTKGIPQAPHKPDFTLVMKSDNLPVQIASVEATMLQKCRARTKSLQQTYTKEFPMGISKMSYSLTSSSVDMSSAVAQFMLPEVLVAPFSAQLIVVSYELRVKISFVPLVSNNKIKPTVLVIETPVILQSPVSDWARDQLQVKPIAAPPYGAGTFSDPGPNSQLMSGGPRSVGDVTAISNFTGTGTTSSYLSYEIQRPGQVVSNVMQWFGKSNDSVY